jgi:tRNA G18 (ribose-2'-O)-methylase SpoU
MTGIRQLRGANEISAALDAGERLGTLLVEDGAPEEQVAGTLERARARGVPVRRVSAAVIRRMTSTGAPSPLLALRGRDPEASLDDVLERGGALWVLTGVAYPTNAGVAIRTAEGSGAEAIVIDAPHLDHAGRRAATRASMRADWYMPVFWSDARDAISRGRKAGHAILAVENSGDTSPWDVDLTGPVLFVVGGEAQGIPQDVLADSDRVLRVPMGGFIPSFNLQIALGVIGVERLRQMAERSG